MTHRSPYRTLAAFLLAVALVLAGLAGLLSTVPARAQVVDAGGATSFSVTAVSGFSFTPNSFQNLATNTTITVTFTDADTLAHTFTILGRQGWVIPTGSESAELLKYAWQSGTVPLANIQLNPSTTTTGTFHAPGVGWYEFFCNETGHFKSGMYGFLAFGEALPGNLTVTTPDTGPGAAVFIIVGTIVSLVIIALVLGFVVGRRRGSHDEMPPERLGYPEPRDAPRPPASPPRG